jgi:hypothetical protein
VQSFENFSQSNNMLRFDPKQNDDIDQAKRLALPRRLLAEQQKTPGLGKRNLDEQMNGVKKAFSCLLQTEAQ